MSSQVDYKNSLNLPKTDFPMKANLPQREPAILKHWQALSLYQTLQQQHQGRPSFVLHDGPPYANGRPHMGTALNKTLKDMVVKSKMLSGYHAPFVPGWDCHGLPIELNVEKKHGKPGVKLSPKAFRQACRDYAAQQVALQSEDFQRLGILADWQHPYLTMDYRYEADAIRALADIMAKGHLQRGEKPVYWCTECASSLAEAEVEYRDKASPSIYVRFDAVDPAAVLQKFEVTIDDHVPVVVPIWTTTPWTLPANQAVCLHPEFSYVLVKLELNHQPLFVIVAEELLGACAQALSWQDYQVHGRLSGRQLEGVMLVHPFCDRHVPIIVGEHVTLEQGTGNVHTAPAHGQDDYRVGQLYGLAVLNPVDSRSCFHDDTPLVAGLHVTKANEPILVHLADTGKLLHQAVLQHSYPHCWRHKTPLIFRATPQWFISMDKQGLRDHAIQAIANTRWIPAWGEARIGKMIETRPDWCISRQRTWGIPIPLLLHKKTQALHPRMAGLMEEVAKRVEQHGIDAWYDLALDEWLGEEANDYDKLTDTLDVWFDSGVSQYCVLQQRPGLSFPADLYLEGSDQHRGWFQTSLLTSVAIREQAPYRTVLTHGYVVDGKGLKMSKSLGNVMLPADVVKNLGADVLRLWAASADYTNDINVSDEILQRAADAYRRIRNTARFLLSNLDDFDPAVDLMPTDALVELDRWAVHYTAQLQAKILEAYERFHFQTVFQLVHNFCSIEMGSFYLDIIKDRLYTAQRSSQARRSAQTAVYHMVEALVRWVAPILSFTAEEIWQHMPGQRSASVFLACWYDQMPAVDTAQVDFWLWFMSLRDEVNKVLEQHRNQGLIGSALEAEVQLYVAPDLFERLAQVADELRFALITSAASVLPLDEAPAAAQATSIEGLRVGVRVLQDPKCVRCWQRREDVGTDTEHPALCSRCVKNVVSTGEERFYA